MLDSLANLATRQGRRFGLGICQRRVCSAGFGYLVSVRSIVTITPLLALRGSSGSGKLFAFQSAAFNPHKGGRKNLCVARDGGRRGEGFEHGCRRTALRRIEQRNGEAAPFQFARAARIGFEDGATLDAAFAADEGLERFDVHLT